MRILFRITVVIQLMVTPAILNAQSSTDADSREESQTLRPLHITDSLHKSSLYDEVPTARMWEIEQVQNSGTASLGETLNGQLGIASTNFGPNAGRPVIRGLNGDRIKILQNGIGFVDASSASDDHAVAMDPFMSDGVELVRGPMTLLYGASSIGGIVNVTNSRIHKTFSEGRVIELGSQFSSNSGSTAIGVKSDYGWNDKWMIHIDGTQRKQGLSAIPNFSRSSGSRLSDPQEPELKYRIQNSENRVATLGGGLSYIGSKLKVGLSAQTYAQEYGTVAEPDVKIHMRQNRYDFDGSYFPKLKMIREIRTKAAITQYAHDELEDGNTGTRFNVSGAEARSEVIHQIGTNLHGIAGIQFTESHFRAKGSEAYLPSTRTVQAAPFVFEEFDLGEHKLDLSGRIEFHRLDIASDLTSTNRQLKNFETASIASTFVSQLKADQTLALNLSYNERAPTFQELYAYGVHMATGTFETGNANLQTEKSYSGEISYKKSSVRSSTEFNLFSQWFDQYIQLEKSGLVDAASGLDVLKYSGVTAQIYGLELENRHLVGHWMNSQWTLFERADYLIGINRSSGQSLSRMTPGRITVGFETKRDQWKSDLSAQYVFYQNRIGVNESQTPGYCRVDMGTSRQFLFDQHSVELYGRIQNLLNQEIRQHVSLLKDLAPAPGRNFMVGLRALF